MVLTDLQAMIMQQEGTGIVRDGHFYPYYDSVGKLTVGYGHNLEAKGLPADVIMMLLNIDIADALEDVRHCFSCYDQLSHPRKQVLVSMALNLGRDGLAKFVHFIGAVHRGDWEEAAQEIINSRAATQAPGRYNPLAKMMRDNVSQWV